MNRKPLVLFPVGYRSEAVLSLPVRKRLRDHDRVEMVKVKLWDTYVDSYARIQEVIRSHEPDFAIINADRIEMAGAAAACFHAGIPFAHMYAGILNNIGTLDDVNRHIMTLQSTMQFCESEVAAERVFNLRAAVKLPVDQVYSVGITHLDDVTPEPCDIPKEPYDLVEYNPPATNLNESKQGDEITSDFDFIMETAGADGRKVIAIMPAPDRGFKYIEQRLNGISRGMDWTVTRGYPRNKFLYVLQHCDRFITNSSAEYYEAPGLLKPGQIIHIGTRNAGRDTGPFQTGASDRIVRILEDYLCTQSSGN